MCPAQRRKQHQTRAYIAFLFAVFSGLAGLGCILIKSPQSQSGQYLALALSAYDRSAYPESALAAAAAVRLDSVDPAGWLILAQALKSNGQQSAAQKAYVIATKLQQKPTPQNPLYASPADLKLSLLALQDGGDF